MKLNKLSIIALALAGAAMASAQMGGMKMDKSRYGGPVYTGAPMLNITISLINVGGGPGKFSIAKALTSMGGSKLVGAEVAKLTKQYGKAKVDSWMKVFDFAVNDATKMAVAAKVKLPRPTMSGKDLATAIVKSGLDKDGTFYTEFMLDKLVTHKIHMAVMDHIDTQFSPEDDANYHRITNQAMVDLAHALGAKSVKLAKFH